jgi:hypothetical protein
MSTEAEMTKSEQRRADVETLTLEEHLRQTIGEAPAYLMTEGDLAFLVSLYEVVDEDG